jgi:putative SOS response-associated peptidase YedK
MCGRFAVTLPPDAMARLFDAQPANDLPEIPNYNVCPTNRIHAVRGGDRRRRLEAMRWGFLPHWYETVGDGPLLINARAESIADKPAFRCAARERRCLVPAAGFYEWTKDADGNRLPWFITRRDGCSMVFAGIWQDWDRGGQAHRSVAIVTCAATDEMARIHHRMPVILAPEDWAKWLGEEGHGAARLMRPAAEGTLDAYRVRTQVNSSRASGPQLVEPLEADDTP